MDSQLNYAEMSKKILTEYATVYAQAGGTPLRVLFDDEHKSYMLLDIGWYEKKYIHHAPIHLEIIEGRIWIQNDDTEEGVATDLLDAGVPKEDSVLGFRHPNIRKYTEFAAVDMPV